MAVYSSKKLIKNCNISSDAPLNPICTMSRHNNPCPVLRILSSVTAPPLSRYPNEYTHGTTKEHSKPHAYPTHLQNLAQWHSHSLGAGHYPRDEPCNPLRLQRL